MYRSLPKTSLLFGGKYDYIDSYQMPFQDPQGAIGPKELGKAFISSSPAWVERLFSLRNRLVSVFGLKTGPSPDRSTAIAQFEGNVGEKLGFFTVFDKTANELIIGEDDKHLNFRVSMYLDTHGPESRSLSISTTVNFHNIFGRLYFFPVKPFHRLIVPRMLKATIRELEKTASAKR